MSLTGHQIMKATGGRRKFNCLTMWFGDRKSLFAYAAEYKRQNWMPVDIDLKSLMLKVIDLNTKCVT